MKNKGFTLIELLAVIIILAIISLIAVPIVLDIINKSKMESIKLSVGYYIDAVEQAVAKEYLKDSKINLDGEYEIIDKGKKITFEEREINIEYKGKIIEQGTIIIEKGKVNKAENLKIDKYYATYKVNDGETKIDLKTESSGVLYNYKIYNTPTLPNEYQELEYIESTGTQYIDTKYINSEDYKPYKIEVDFQFTSITSSSYVFGTVRNVSNYYPFTFGIDSSKQSWIFGHFGNAQLTTLSVRFGTFDTNRHNVKYVFGEGVYFDGVLEETTVSQAQTSSNSTKKIVLFAWIRNNTVDKYSKIKMYSCKFYEENDVLVRNFIPCYRKSDNAIGLYDLANNEFYENSGSGSFISGPNVEYLYGKYNETTGKYEIKISLMSENVEYDNYKIVLNSPLKEGEYIEYKKGSIVRMDGTLEKIDLPKIKITKPNTTLVVDENGKIEVEMYK